MIHATEPAPAPADERAAMIEVIVRQLPRSLGSGFEEAGNIAAALLAAGWTRGGDAAGQLAALTAAINAERDALIKYDRTPSDRGVSAGPKGRAYSRWLNCRADVVAALARPSAPETLAWAVLGEDGAVIPSLIRESRSLAATGLFGRKRIVRVAMRVVEDGA